MLHSGVAAGAGETTPLRVGDAAPELSLLDIEGERMTSEQYRDWVQVITFADRESSEAMKSWMSDSQIRVTRAHPEVPVAYLSFADLSAVPRFLRGVIRPVLRKSFENSNEQLAESYRKVGIDPDPSKVVFRFLPDWDGTYLEVFGIEDASSYRCWLAVDGKVVAAFDASTPDIGQAYVDAFDALVEARVAVVDEAELTSKQPPE